MNRADFFIAWLFFTVFAGFSCDSFDCRTENESRDLLRHVPVPLGVPPAGAAEASAPAGVVRRQTYTIDKDGDFTFHRSIETSVGHLGVETGTLDRQSAEWLGAEPFAGVLVRSVEKRSPASFAGLRPDDVIVSCGGKPVLSADRLEYLIEEKMPGDLVDLEVLRAKEKIKLTAELGSEKRIESANGTRQKLAMVDDRDRTGLRLVELTDETRPIVLGAGVAENGLLVVDVLPGGPGYFAGVRPRDYLTRAGEQPLGSLGDYTRVIGSLKSGDDVHFTLRRDGASAAADVRVVSNATAESGFNLPFVVKYETKPDHKKFSLLLGFLFNHERCFSIREKAGAAESYSSRNWGAILDLIAYQGNSRGKGRLRFLWIIPIWWGAD